MTWFCFAVKTINVESTEVDEGQVVTEHGTSVFVCIAGVRSVRYLWYLVVRPASCVVQMPANGVFRRVARSIPIESGINRPISIWLTVSY